MAAKKGVGEAHWYAVLVWGSPDGYIFVSDTFVLRKSGGFYICQYGKVRVRSTGLHIVDGQSSTIVAEDIENPNLWSKTQYFIYVCKSEAQAEAFATGCLATRAVSEVAAVSRMFSVLSGVN